MERTSAARRKRGFVHTVDRDAARVYQNGMPGRISQRDIARRAGVDVSTVSLALGDHPRIPAATKARIRTWADELGYRPDPALSSIAANRWQGRRDVKGVTLAFLSDDLRTAEPELKLYHQGIVRQAAELGYGVQAFPLGEEFSIASFLRIVRARGIRGIVVGQSRRTLPDGLFSGAAPPIVHCGFLKDVPTDVVCPDLRHAVEVLLRHVSAVYRKVACFLPVERSLNSDHVILGTVLAMVRVRSVGRVHAVPAPEIPRESDWRALRKIQPDAVVVINEKQARQLRERSGLPGDVPVYTLHTLPPFGRKAGMDLRMGETGRVAVNFLEMKMRRLPLSTASFSQTVLLEPRLLAARKSAAVNGR